MESGTVLFIVTLIILCVVAGLWFTAKKERRSSDSRNSSTSHKSKKGDLK